MKLKIAHQLYLAFGLFVVLTLAVTLWIKTIENDGSEVASEVRNDDVPGVIAYLQVMDEFGDVYSDAMRYAMGDANSAVSLRKNMAELEEWLVELDRLEGSTDYGKKIIAELRGYQREINQLLNDKVLTAPAGNVPKDAIERIGTPLTEQAEDLLEREVLSEKKEAEDHMDAILVDLARIGKMLTILVAVVLVVGAVLAWWLSHSIGQRVALVVKQAEAIARGDLSVPPLATGSGDELGQLAVAVNAMQNSLRTLLSEIIGVAQQVSTSTDELSNISSQVAEGSRNQAQKAELIATAIEQMHSTVNEVAQQSSSAASISQQAGADAHQGGQIMHDTENSINRVSSVVTESAETVDSLGKRGEQIGQIISVITSIAEQTNLLALNAAIEAARAGDAGRGFAVVADEVRGLAERTAKATKEVSESINAIQSETEKAVQRMGQGTRLVTESVQLTNEAADALRKIVQGAENVNSMIQAIATATEEQTAVTREIAADVTYISDVAKETVSLTDNVAGSARDLNGRVEQLEDLVSRFKL